MTLKQNARFACRPAARPNLDFLREYEREVVLTKVRVLGLDAFSVPDLINACPGVFVAARLERLLREFSYGRGLVWSGGRNGQHRIFRVAT